MVIESILAESRQHYRNQYDQVIARLLHIPKGSLRRQKRNRTAYWYLRRFVASKNTYEDIYLGPVDDPVAESLVAFVGERKIRKEELKTVKHALKQLGISGMDLQNKGYPSLFLQLIEAFGQAGLWNEGLTLIGSWCYNVYVQALGVEYFPLRTMDFDFGLRLPYQGEGADVHALLLNLGFSPRIDMAYDKVDYVLPGVGMVEIFSDRQGATEEQLAQIKKRLSLKPAVVSNLNILIDQPVTIKVHGIHKSITVPSLPAFYIHRLITAASGEYRDPVLHPYKIRKNYKQAGLVAKKILDDDALRQETAGRILSLSHDLRNQFDQGAIESIKYVKAPDLTDTDIQYICKLAVTV